MLSYESLKGTIQGETSKQIKAMREDFSTYVRHVFGTGTDEFLALINQYENTKQHELRKKHAIKNPWIIDELTRPIDNIWQARGGSEVFKFKGTDKTEDLKTFLQDVRGGISINAFMKEIWLQRFISDPNGVIFLEVEKGGESCCLTYKSIMSIKDYDVDGSKLEWIVFEPAVKILERGKDENGKEIEMTIEYSWAVDERFYYYCKNTGKEFIIEQVIEHSFGQVPGVVNSPIYNTEKGYRVSLIDKQVDLLNSYLTKNSIKEIYQFKHNFAIPWMIETLCPTCNGKRKVGNEVCGTCGGTGYSAHKDVSDVLIIPKSEPDIDNIIPPAGYIQPEVSTCDENRKELDWLFNKMFHSLWGTTTEQMSNETATGKFIDTMPVYNKLNTIADIAQSIQRQLTIIVGKFYFPATLEDVNVSYSRRYIIESPDALWTRYVTAKEKKAPDQVLNYMLEQFYYSEFASNTAMADHYIKMMYVEPYVHKSIEEVNAMMVPDAIKKAKMYFAEWNRQMDESDMLMKTANELEKELMSYSKSKI